MCIIVKKDKGTKIDFEMLENCFDRNSDGAGFMFVSDKGVEIHKGYMSWNEFENGVKELCNDNQEIVFHFRISTGVLTNEGNCHPFPVTNNFDEYQQTHIIVDTAMCHNGIMSTYEKRDNYSDTQHFVNEFLYPLKACGADLFDASALPLIKGIIGNYNKLAIMDKDKGTTLIGNFETDKKYEGYTFSNGSYVGFTYTPTKSTYKYTPSCCSTYNYNYKKTNAEPVYKHANEDFWKGVDIYPTEEDDYTTAYNTDDYNWGGVGNDITEFDNGDIIVHAFDEFEVDVMLTECKQLPTDSVIANLVREYWRIPGEIWYNREDMQFILVDDLDLYYTTWDIIEMFRDELKDMGVDITLSMQC